MGGYKANSRGNQVFNLFKVHPHWSNYVSKGTKEIVVSFEQIAAKLDASVQYQHFANWRFGNYISNCPAITKEISSGRPPNSAIPKSTISLVRSSRKDQNERGTNWEEVNRYVHFRVTTKFTWPRLKDTRKMHNLQSRFCDKNWGGERWWLGWLKKGERNRSNDERKLNKSLKLQRGLIWGRKGYPSKMSFPIDGKEIRCLMTSDEKIITDRFSLAEGSN